MADGIAINKSDGNNVDKARIAKPNIRMPCVFSLLPVQAGRRSDSLLGLKNGHRCYLGYGTEIRGAHTRQSFF